MPNEPIDTGDAFVIARLREKPVSYSVKITHLVIDGTWQMAIEVHDVLIMDAENRARVADDLRHAAMMIENGPDWSLIPPKEPEMAPKMGLRLVKTDEGENLTS